MKTLTVAFALLLSFISCKLHLMAAEVSNLEAAGGRVTTLSQNDARLEVTYHLADQKIVDENLHPLLGMANIYLINLRGTAITDAGLKSLSGLESLVRLHLEKTAISDAGLVHLAGLKNLEYLNLYGTKVSDAGLMQLEGLKSLKKLYLWESLVTWQGVQKLQLALPDCEIISGLSAPVPPETKEPEQTEEKKP